METKLKDILKAKKKHLKKKAVEIITDAAETMEKEVKGKVKITIEDEGMKATVESTIPNAASTEYGTSASPFFNAAFEIARQKLIKDLNNIQ